MVIYDCSAWGKQRNTTQEYLDALDKLKYKFECGHIVIITTNENKKICSWCGKYVFTNKKEEFKYRINEKMKGCL